MGALRALVAPMNRAGRFFSAVKISGAHANSMRMIRNGEADVAAIDCVTYALIKWYRPAELDGIRKLGRTYRAPGVPYVARATESEDRLARMRTAIFRSFDNPSLNDLRRALFLRGLEVPEPSAYRRIARQQQKAVRHGYPRLA
jgi:ABC-type phosphate/phosphonate transport system substrate-binding protein